MLLSEVNSIILTEMTERLNRLNSYGSWIDSNTGEFYDVSKEGGHIDFIRSRLKEWGVPAHLVRNSDAAYTVGFSKGLVRTVYSPKTVLVVDGLSGDIAKISHVIMATAAQPDMEIVRINKVKNLGDPGTNMRSFEVPAERGELARYINL